MTLNVVIGPPAAGKTTYVQTNAESEDVIVDFDAIAKALGSPVSHQPPADIKRVALAARKAAIKEVLALGSDTNAWVIHSWPSEKQLEEYEDAGAEFHTVDPGIDQVLEQAEKDQRPEGTEDLIRQWYAQQEQEGAEGAKSMARDTRKYDSAVTVQKTAAMTVTKVSDPEGDDDYGGFEALVAVFGNVDTQHDKVLEGAFAESIASEKVFAAIWAHQWYDDSAFIGSFTATETHQGLLIKATYLDTPRAQHVRELMRIGLVTEFSWSGKVLEGAWVETEDEYWYEIRKVDLWEAGPCFKGANPETELLSVKSALQNFASKEGRVLAQKHVDSLREAHTILSDLLDSVDKAEETKSSSSHPPTISPPGHKPGHHTKEASANAGASSVPPHIKALLALSGERKTK